MPRRPARPRRGPTRPKSSRTGSALRRLAWQLALVLVLLGGIGVAWLDAVVTTRFENHRWTVPARVHARPLALHAGKPLTAGQLEQELQLLGYRPVAEARSAGEYARSDDGQRMALVTRGFSAGGQKAVPQQVALAFSPGRIEQMRAGTDVVLLEPPLIGAIRPTQAEDRILMRLEERPPWLVEALIAVEDRAYPDHIGISPRGILRALVVNVSAGEYQQGGSTLTQQLVKNFWLTSERSLWRKGVEALMAVLLELHYDKALILETYCNEIYLGQAGEHPVHGFALAARHYFGRPLADLRLHEVALLVGLVRGPSYYNPWRQPQRALARRNQVLDAMVETGVLTAAQADAARALPLGVAPSPVVQGDNRYPAFMALLRRELRDRLDESQLAGDGLQIFTTLDPLVQQAAEVAVQQGLASVEQAHGVQGLQAALLVAHPGSGAIEAAVGDRRVDFAGFNRTVDARRPVGSLFKPLVFLAALERPERYSLASWVSDAPLEVKSPDGKRWSPRNYDHVSHGTPPEHRVVLVDALANSWNQATARLGLEVGIDATLDLARDLGVTGPLPPYPSVLLGSATLSPLDVLTLYQPLATGGQRSRPHAVLAVLADDGTPLYQARPAPERVVDPAKGYLLTWALQQAMREGTGRSAYATLAPELAAAGKTGTTDDGRDSWFAGYTASHLAVAWVGFDDNRPTPLSGATGALPLWVRLMGALPQVPLPDAAPSGVEWAWLAPGGAARSAEGCEGARQFPVIAGTVPEASTLCGKAVETGQGIKGFFRRLFD